MSTHISLANLPADIFAKIADVKMYFDKVNVNDWQVLGIGPVAIGTKPVVTKDGTNWKEALEQLKKSIKEGEVGDDEIDLLEKRIINATQLNSSKAAPSNNKSKMYSPYRNSLNGPIVYTPMRFDAWDREDIL